MKRFEKNANITSEEEKKLSVFVNTNLHAKPKGFYHMDSRVEGQSIKEVSGSPKEIAEYIADGNALLFMNAVCIDVDNHYHNSMGCLKEGYNPDELIEKITMKETLNVLEDVGIEPCLAYQSFNSTPECEKFHLIIPVDNLNHNEYKKISKQFSLLFGYGYDDTLPFCTSNVRRNQDSEFVEGTLLYGTDKEILVDDYKEYTPADLIQRLEKANIKLREKTPDIDKCRLDASIKANNVEGNRTTNAIIENLGGNISISSDVAKIGGGTFSRCTALKSIDIPDSVKEIGGYAFDECKNLTSVNIPNSVTKIGYEAFVGCDNLKIICNKGSCAETYAKEYHFPIEYLEKEQAYEVSEASDASSLIAKLKAISEKAADLQSELEKLTNTFEGRNPSENQPDKKKKTEMLLDK